MGSGLEKRLQRPNMQDHKSKQRYKTHQSHWTIGNTGCYQDPALWEQLSFSSETWSQDQLALAGLELTDIQLLLLPKLWDQTPYVDGFGCLLFYTLATNNRGQLRLA